MALKIGVHPAGDSISLSLEGNIDEESEFAPLPGTFSKVSFDLKGVRAINSVGIKMWLKWLDSMGTPNYTFENCPVAFVMQMNMVEGFLPKNSVVATFSVPYYCESCDEESRALFSVGQDVVLNGDTYRIANEERKCAKGCELELDANETKYFRFLQKVSGAQAA